MIRPTHTRALVVALAGLLLAGGGPAIAGPAVSPATFAPGDAFALAWATDARISPDGRTVAYVRMTQDIMTDVAHPAIWLVDVATARQTPLGAADSTAPRWSPDGRRLGYVAKATDGTRQLFVRWLATGAATALTTGPEAPGDLAWSPSGDRIAFARFVPGDPKPVPPAVEKPEGAKWAAPIRVIDRADFRSDDAGFARPGNRRLFVVSAEGGAARQLTSGDADDGGPLAWMPDGRHIVFASNHGPDRVMDRYDTEVFTLDIGTLATTQLTRRKGPDDEVAVSPDGAWIAYTGFDDEGLPYTNRRLIVMRADGSGGRVLTDDLDRDVHDPVWSADGRSLHVRYEDRGTMVVARVALDGKRVVVANDLKGDELDRPYTGGTFSLARDGTIAFGGNAAALPPELMVAGRGRARTLTALNGDLFAGKTLATLRPLPVTSAADGRAIGAWMLLPPGYQPGRRYPAILEIHGGPHSAYGPAWSTTHQLYARAGYVVLFGNPRGSTSYGAEFANTIRYAFPSKDYDDLMSIVDTAVAGGVVDPGNLFVTGGSGGGLLTAWIVSQTPRFRAAMAQKPVVNWISESLSSDIYPYMARYWFAKAPWDDMTTYWAQSPISRVGRITTPTAVMVGEDDARTPPGEAEQLYNALSLRRVPTMLVRVPDAGHSNLAERPSQLTAQVAVTLQWFDRYRAVASEGHEQ